MKGVDLYARIRRAVDVEGMSQRGAARHFGIDPRTVAKMMRYSVPPGYRRCRPPARPKLDPFTGIIDQILDDDGSMPTKQRHTAKRIFERLRDDHGYRAATRPSRITCGCVGDKSARCSCRCRTRRAMARPILAKPWP